MSLKIGTRLGPYEVLGVIGAGAMGEVYRARDTNLQRIVAIKVLPEAVAGNPRRLLRFEREARALATLNHPNIAMVYAVEGQAIVMEVVEGEDLSNRIKRGPIALTDALPIARQVAEALAAAHEAGIVHRDLKPANIKVRGDGTVKVLDFGLATTGSADSDTGSGSGSADLPPTLTLNDDLTRDGTVVGTAAYMAPEQAKGIPVDKRADIWAFGVVVFEMLAGRRPFDDGDVSDPEWTALPAGTPPAIRRLLTRCLTRDRKHRLHDIADARIEIDEAITPRLVGAATHDRRWARQVMWASLWLLTGIVIGVFVWKAPAAAPAVAYARLEVSPAAELNAGGIFSVVLPAGGALTALAWSSDGRTLGFIGLKNGVRQVYLRDLASNAARPLAGTEGARTLTFSPDGADVAFWADNSISSVKIAGGPIVKICQASSVAGINWGERLIAFSQGNLWLTDAVPAGREAQKLSTTPQLVRQSTPFLLPGDAALLYTEYDTQWTSGTERVMVRSLAPGAEPKVLLRNAADARYLSSGHLLFLKQGTLFAVPFDARTLELRGEAVAVLKGVGQSVVALDSDDLTLAGQFAISPQGMLAYVASPLASYPERELVTVDRSGRIAPLGAPLRGYRSHIEASPDGTRLGVSIQTATGIQPFAYDLRRRALSRIADTLNGEVILAAWARDDRIAVQVIDAGKITAAIVRPDVASRPEPVANTDHFWASSLSSDGRLTGMLGGDIWLYAVNEKDARPTVFPQTKYAETQPMWSPDGRWLAYSSSTTGRLDVYIRSFPELGEAVTVSLQGGSSPVWNPNGRELFYLEPGPEEDRMMAVTISTPGQPLKPTALFSFPHGGLFLGTVVLASYAVSANGQYFYAVRDVPRPANPVTEVSVIFNWFQELKTKVPGFGGARRQ